MAASDLNESQKQTAFWLSHRAQSVPVSLGLTILVFISRKSTWVHVRVQEKDGANIAISMPLPLSLASWAIDYAREFVDGEALDNLEMAATAIAAAQENFSDPSADPIMINVDDEDAQVQVFIG